MKTSPLIRFFALSLGLLPLLPAAAIAAETPKKVLVVTITVGFRHSCIPLSEKIIEQLAKESGKFTVEFVSQPEGMPRPPPPPRGAKADDAAKLKFAADEKAYNETWPPKVAAALQKLSPANLKNYDAVIFASTTGDLPLPDPQGFVDWIASGKGFVGVHSATDTFHKTGNFVGFPPYVAMIGAAFRTHGPQVTVDCINQDPKHAACSHLPAKWTLFDEIYQFKEHDPAKVHRLLTLESLMLTGDDVNKKKATPGDYSIAWTKMHGRGRVFYTALGHREDLWDPTYTEKDGTRKNSPENAKLFQQHLLNGILWSLGLAPGSVTP